MDPTSLSDLEIFAAVAKYRSFRRAATDRGVTPGRISQSIRKLEDHLDLKLLHRTTRSVTLTEAGAELIRSIQPALDNISEALERLNSFRESPSGRLKINAPLPAVHLVLGPLTASFLRAYPRIQLEISSDDALVDVLAEGFDAGVRYGEDLPLDMIAVQIGKAQRRLAVAAPSYLEREGVPNEPDDLVKHRLIAHRFSRGNIYTWDFMKNGVVKGVTPTGALIVNDPILELRAAIDGAGIACVFEDYARDAVRAGSLTIVCEDWSTLVPAPYLYFSSRKLKPAPLAAFIGFARQEQDKGTSAVFESAA